jgi:neutral ceramidase
MPGRAGTIQEGVVMRKRIAILLVLLVLAPAARAEGLRAGAAKVDVTPPIGHAMWGYAARKDTACIGVRDRLHARVLVLEASATRLALVSLDLGRAPTRTSMEAIRKRAAATGVGHLLLVASHTHHGPVLELDNWPTPEKPYVRQLEQKLGDAIAEAARNLRPARWGVASKQVPFNRNRQSKRPDAPVDRELLILRVEDTEGKLIAHAVNFAAHPVMRDIRDLRFSADYPGALAEFVEKETGAPCLFLQGAAGDLSPNPAEVRRAVASEADGADRCEAFGRAVGREALALARTVRCSAADKPQLDVREEDLAFKARLNLGSPLIRFALEQAFFPELIAFYEREYREGVRPHLSVALLDGRVGFVGVSGEFFSGHALALKRRARLEHLFFLGYCNDYQQYFPTIEAAAESGYGTERTVSPVETGAGERVMDRALIHLYQLRGKLP